MARRMAALLASLVALGCARSGEVIVVLDSTMRAGAVEVVAYPLDAAADTSATRTRSASPSPSPGSGPRHPLDDSAAALATRFSILRDSLNDEVAALANVDRRSRAYAVRYAEIRRRTLAAEQIRVQRDTARARALAARAGAAAAGSAPSSTGTAIADSTATRRNEGDVRRFAVQDSVVILSLAPGRWSIGVAPRGSMPRHSSNVSVVRGERDTLRLSISGASSRETP